MKFQEGGITLRTSLQQFGQDLHEPWQWALFLVAVIPLFPEYVSFLLVIAAAVFAWQDIRKSNRPLVIGTVGKLLLAFCGWQFITVFYSSVPWSSLGTAAMWLFFFLIYIIFENVLTDADRFDTLMFDITAVAAIVGLIACVQYRVGFFFKGTPIEIWQWLDNIVYRYLPFQISETAYTLRSCATFANPNVLAEYLMAVAPFVAYFNFCERREDLRLFNRVALFLTFGGVIFSFSRGGYIALLVLVVALILLNIRHRFATVSLYVISALLIIPDEVVERLLSVLPGISTGTKLLEKAATGSAAGSSATVYATTAEIINNSPADFAVSERWRIWLDAFSHIGNRPLFGYGAGVSVTKELLFADGFGSIHAHNIVFQLLLEGGAVALILMLLIGFKVVKNGIELMRHDYGSFFWIGFAVTGFAVVFCVQGLVDYPLLTPKLIANFIMVLAITERAAELFSHHPIAVRKTIREHFRRRIAKEKSTVD